MALFNEILVGRFNRATQKFTGIKGQAPAPQLGAEITPSLLVADLESVDVRYLMGWDLYSAFQTQIAGGAGNFNQVQLRNPAASNVVAVLEKITVFESNTADTFTWKVFSQVADLASIGALTNSRLDGRGRPAPTLIESFTSAAQFSGSLGAGGFAAGTSYDIIVTHDQEIPVLPGNAFIIQQGTANIPFSVSIRWRERYLEESERA